MKVLILSFSNNKVNEDSFIPNKKGFNKVEIHKFMEVRDNIVSFKNLNINRESYDELFNRAVVGVIKI